MSKIFKVDNKPKILNSNNKTKLFLLKINLLATMMV